MRLLALVLLLGVACPAASAAAEPLEKRKQEVKRKSDEAQALLKAGKSAEAGARFEEAYAVLPDLALLFAAATAYGRAWDANKDPKALDRAVALLEQLVEQDVVRKQSALSMLGQYKPLLMREQQKAREEVARKAEEVPKKRARLGELIREGTQQFQQGAFDDAARAFTEAHALATAVAPEGLTEPADLVDRSRPWQLLLAAGRANAEVWKKARTPEALRRAVASYRQALSSTKDPAASTKITPKLGPLEEELDAIEVASARGLEACDLADRLLERGKLAEAEQVARRVAADADPGRPLFLASLRVRARLAARRSENALEPRKDLEEAVRAWRGLLSLEPGFALPAGAGAVEKRTFDIAQKGMQTRKPLRIVVSRAAKPTKEGVGIEVKVISDPEELVKRVRLQLRRGTQAWEMREAPIEGGGALLLAPEGAGKLQLAVALLGDRGARLADLGSEADPLSADNPGEIATFDARTNAELK